jgi:hypothetical protein
MATYAELQSALETRERSLAVARGRERKASETVKAVAVMAGGGAAAAVSAGLVGFIEGRVRNKDGSMISLGPVSLPAAVATLSGLATAGMFAAGMPIGSQIASHITSANAGLATGTWARAQGALRRQKVLDGQSKDKKGVGGSGDPLDALSPEERKLFLGE